MEGVAIMQPGEGSGSEGVAGANRIHDVHGDGADARAGRSRGTVRARRSQRHEDKADAVAEDSLRSGDIVESRIEPGQILGARLHDGALRDQPVQTWAVL